MCTLIVLFRPEHPWPLLLAANRDEMSERPSLPPARHWPDRPQLVAGLDRLGGGSWMGMNDTGLVAAVMNREGSLGRLPGKRSRGELVLEALDHADAGQAIAALRELNPIAYRPFNLLVADPMGAYWVRHSGDGDIESFAIEPGLHMLSARELDDAGDPRIRFFLPRFRAAQSPEPETADWSAWLQLLAERQPPDGEPAVAAMNLDLPNGFATLSSSLLALPRYPGFNAKPVWLYADGSPDRAPFNEVKL